MSAEMIQRKLPRWTAVYRLNGKDVMHSTIYARTVKGAYAQARKPISAIEYDELEVYAS